MATVLFVSFRLRFQCTEVFVVEIMSEFHVYKGNPNITSRHIIKNSKEYEKNEARERKRNLLYLIANYLREQNLHESADALCNEAQLSNQFEVCDNVDLDIIYQDYESYYHTKFNKSPKLVKKLNLELKASDSYQAKRKVKMGNYHRTTFNTNSNMKSPETKMTNGNEAPSQPQFQIDVTSLTNPRQSENKSEETSKTWTPPNEADNILARPLCDFRSYTAEWREMAEVIVKEIIPKNLGVKWTDCIGLEDTIEILKEAAVYPLIYPELFTGLIAPWRGILLYGPPGTGKTLLARALACETRTTFINLTSSSFVSKWRGESEKMIKVLFDVARYYAPTTIFVDEVDALASRNDDNHHDAARRFKSELLVQLDGILGINERIVLLATTNSPWDLDVALIRRFEKRIFLDVPSERSRSDLFKYFFSKTSYDFSDGDYGKMAEATKYFSGSDIRMVCKEVVMNIVREQLAHLNKSDTFNKPDKILFQEVLKSIEKIKPVANLETLKKYTEWTKYFSIP